ncbi:molybdenum cofactor guanylyltransferase MobA [Chelativorans sp.]|uniref:molybdenum cofactor guanylyltransferase MobA n=1 Tax=Chelativorans sp. TaxID=2203393 RepID=UPI0028123FB3|nr:molybdenum cofactor guanylyltransferase MobA [Chelativorans sp.]
MDRKVAGIILAGGKSSRMGGGDKALHLLAGRPILTHVADRLGRQVDVLAINANGDPARFTEFGLAVVADPQPDLGPLGGVLAGLLWARSHACPCALTVACDTPFFPEDLVKRLRDAADQPDRIVQSSSGGRTHPTFALWPVSLAEDLDEFLRQAGAASMRAYAGARHRPAVVDFAVAGGVDPFFNINTRDDLIAAERIASEIEG